MNRCLKRKESVPLVFSDLLKRKARKCASADAPKPKSVSHAVAGLSETVQHIELSEGNRLSRTT